MTISIHWFRKDLRLSDNPALNAAALQGKVLPLYIDDTQSQALGAASRCWLQQSLQRLNQSLQGKLLVLCGEPLHILQQLIQTYPVSQVTWTRSYEPQTIARDTLIKQVLKQQGIQVASFNGSLLWEPWQVHKADGSPYKVFTPFYRRGCLQIAPPRQPFSAPNLDLVMHHETQAIKVLKRHPNLAWQAAMMQHWQAGEAAAQQQLAYFLDSGLDNYKVGRDFPAQAHVSRLSPHLCFGEISPNQVWYAARYHGDNTDIDHFCSELAWREFSYYLLYHFPQLRTHNLNTKFDQFPWQLNKQHLQAWQQGQTGYPIIDAGMRQLWQSGYMHNRIRMLVGSFLVKNLLIPWQQGERWFWDCLVDADAANNAASWQWVAGCGADAAPYFRIFNPTTQAKKFDPEGAYIRRYLPELARLPQKYLYEPWLAPAAILQQAAVRLGKDYPLPIVELADSRQQALASFATLKNHEKR